MTGVSTRSAAPVFMLDVGLDMLSDAEIVVVTFLEVDLFFFKVTDALEVSVGLLTRALISAASDTGAKVNANGLATVAPALEIVRPTP